MAKKKDYPKRVRMHTRYELEDGTVVPGVTTVLGLLGKPALMPWANNLGKDGIDYKTYLDHLASVGTLAHQLITDSLICVETDLHEYSQDEIDRARKCVEKWEAWKLQHNIEKVYFVEKPLVSRLMKFGGTCDIYAKVDGKDEIIDLKTSSSVYESHRYQLAALKMLLECNNYNVDRVRVLVIPRDDNAAFQEHILTEKQILGGKSIFVNLLNVYEIQKSIGDR